MPQTTQIELDYLMTLHAEMDAPQVIGSAGFIFNVKGGWVEGPKIKAKIKSPAADWLLHALPTGARRIDVRLTLVTDDDQLVFSSYNGIITHSEASGAKARNGEVVTPADGAYMVITPTFQTGSEKYSWLNRVQTVGKLTQYSSNQANRFIAYDIFVVR